MFSKNGFVKFILAQKLDPFLSQDIKLSNIYGYPVVNAAAIAKSFQDKDSFVSTFKSKTHYRCIAASLLKVFTNDFLKIAESKIPGLNPFNKFMISFQLMDDDSIPLDLQSIGIWSMVHINNFLHRIDFILQNKSLLNFSNGDLSIGILIRFVAFGHGLAWRSLGAFPGEKVPKLSGFCRRRIQCIRLLFPVRIGYWHKILLSSFID